MESSVLWHPVKKIGAGTAQSKRVHQDYKASHTATLLYNNYKGQHKLRSHGMWLNLIAESSNTNNYQPLCNVPLPTAP